MKKGLFMDTFKNRFFPNLRNQKKRFYPMYCTHKGTSNDIIFRSSLILSAIFLACAVLQSCKTVESDRQAKSEHEKFIEAEKGQGELFRVLYMSDTYKVKQMWALDSIFRNPDPGGDSYMCNELKKHDKFEEVKESVVSVWLYPDSGALMKIRPKEPTFLFEIDRLILEDIQRWTFKFPRKTITPSKFDVRYRVVIRKTLSDQEILKDLQESLKEKSQY